VYVVSGYSYGSDRHHVQYMDKLSSSILYPVKTSTVTQTLYQRATVTTVTCPHIDKALIFISFIVAITC